MTLAETLVFRLSCVLGGRTEVLNTPVIELLAHLIMLKDKEQIDRLTNFMDMMFANSKNDQARNDYIKSIQPDSQPLKTELGGGAGKTDFNQLEMIKKQQQEMIRKRGLINGGSNQ
jgi:hypothetical protein